MPKGKILCAQLNTVLFKVYNYFAKLEHRGSTRGTLRRTLEATGEQKSYSRFLYERKCFYTSA